MEYFYSLVSIFQVVVMLGLVIFVHELGHFWVARWCGVYVERFSIGFGPILWRWRGKETEYALSVIPLGGYVKMLGQTDTPEVEEQTDDPRSYQNKSVLQRMAIISAGVIMNLIFGMICYIGAFMIGVPYQKTVLQTVQPGLPAWNAGLRPGDELTKVNNVEDIDYNKMRMEIVLTDPKSEHVDITVTRPLDPDSDHLQFEMKPFHNGQTSVPIVGVSNADSNRISQQWVAQAGTSAAKLGLDGFQPLDWITHLNDIPIKNSFDYYRALQQLRDQTITYTVQRPDDPKRFEDPKASTTTLRILVPPALMKRLGLRMLMGPITAIQKGSVAEKAGIQVGDRILAVDGIEQLDPIFFPEMMARKVGQEITLTVIRPGSEQEQIETFRLTPDPAANAIWSDYPSRTFPDFEMNLPQGVSALGLAYDILDEVEEVYPQSPAAQSSQPIQPKDKIQAATVNFYTEEEVKKRWATASYTPEQIEKLEKIYPILPKTNDALKLDFGRVGYQNLFAMIQLPQMKEVELTLETPQGQTYKVTLQPQADPTWAASEHGLVFKRQIDSRVASSLWEAARLGVEETKYAVIKLYLSLRGLILNRTISTAELNGPVAIATEAYSRAQYNFGWLLQFLAFININLAVVNFLPIPILDGGHMVFLLYESVMRRQPSNLVIGIANATGFVLIIALMIYVVALDIYHFFFA